MQPVATPHSFDLFDTLLGRLHYSPKSTFELVENFFPFPGFVFFRIAAEYKSDKTLKDIYAHLQQLTGMTEAEASTLMEFEYSMELSQIFPIVENIHLVKEGDLIVSDTYYDENQIRGILAKIGLDKPVRIYATPSGKGSGLVWDEIQKEHAIVSHLGDSLHSDVHMAQSRGINAVHYTNSQLSIHEQIVTDMGQPELAHLMRALRLQNPYSPTSPEYLFWNEQCQLNVPFLIQSCLHIDQLCQKEKKSRVLFTTRDSCLLVQLFRALYPHYHSIDFHTSRHTYMNPSPSFIDYVKGVYTGDTLIVDLQGSGISCQRFFSQYLGASPAFLMILTNGMVPGENKHSLFQLIDWIEGCQEKTRGVVAEMMNYDLIGTLYDIQDGEMLRAPPEYDLCFIQPSHLCIQKCVELLPSFSFDALNLQVIEWAIKTMDLGLALEQYVHPTGYHLHIFEQECVKHVHLGVGTDLSVSTSPL